MSAARAVRWTAAGNLVRSLTAVVQLLLVARFVSVPEFGLVVITSAIVLLVQGVSEAGLSSAIIRFRDVTEGERSSLYWANVALGAASTVVVALLSPVAARLYDAEALSGLLQIAGVSLLINSLWLQLRVSAERDLHFHKVAPVEMLGTAVNFAVTMGLVVNGFGAASVVWGQVASAGAAAIAAWIVLGDGWRPGLHFRLSEVRRFLPYGRDMVLVNAITSLTIQADMLISSLFFTPVQAGSYGQPRDLNTRVMSAITPVVNRVGLPLMAASQSDVRNAGAIYLNLVRLNVSVCFPVYLFLGVAAFHALPSVLGARWQEAAQLFPVIALWFAARSVVSPLGTFLAAIGRSRLAVACQLGFLVMTALAAWGGAQGGPFWLAAAMTLTYVVFAEIAWALVLRPVAGIGFLEYHAVLVRPGLCVAAGVLVMAGAVMALKGVGAAPLPAVLVGGAAGSLVLAGGYLLLNRDVVRQAISLIGGRRARAA